MLCSVGRRLVTEVSGQNVTPIIKVQAEFLLDCLKLDHFKGGQSLESLKKNPKSFQLLLYETTQLPLENNLLKIWHLSIFRKSVEKKSNFIKI